MKNFAGNIIKRRLKRYAMKASFLFLHSILFLLIFSPVFKDESYGQSATELLDQMEDFNGEESKNNNFQEGMEAYLRRDYKAAFKIFKLLADQGHAMAQLQLGELYELGWGVSQDYAEAAKWFRKASRQGEFRASEQLFRMYHEGRGVVKDEVEAQKWLLKASEQKNNRAIKFYRREAEQGKAYAQFNLGKMYAKGKDVPQDDLEAVKWYRKAAEQGHGSAQNNLGVKYSKGEGVLQDYVQAYMWFSLAEAKRIAVGRKNRDEIEKLMTPEQIAEAQKLARDWKPEIEKNQ